MNVNHREQHRIWRQTVYAARTLIVFFTLNGLQCQPEKLAISDSYLCNRMSADHCSERIAVRQHFRPQIPEYKSQTWFDLGYYMYFHTRETPGLWVRFNRPLSKTEQKAIQTGLHCHLELEDQSGHRYSQPMEGKRIGRDFFWCFDYLGGHLVSMLKEQKRERSKPQPAEFPYKMRIQWHVDGVFQSRRTPESRFWIEWRKP
ncbi:MAG: hypothetical protein KDK39_17535 [Leptospiraceae bacterium]|nr:hypothetical protein [Leptospiraceae bacterium]